MDKEQQNTPPSTADIIEMDSTKRIPLGNMSASHAEVEERLKMNTGTENTRTQSLQIINHLLNDRGADYGDAIDNFERIAIIWTAIFGIPVTRAQVALCMAGVKMARLVETPEHDDSWLDLSGYGILGREVYERPETDS